MTARANTMIGTLTVTAEYAEFVPGEVPPRMAWSGDHSQREERVCRFQAVREVLVGRRGSGFFNRWIEMRYGDPDHPSTVYLNDGGRRGWRPILKGTNRQMAGELKSLISPSGGSATPA
jgi:hypothetical protein